MTILIREGGLDLDPVSHWTLNQVHNNLPSYPPSLNSSLPFLGRDHFLWLTKDWGFCELRANDTEALIQVGFVTYMEVCILMPNFC